VKYLLRVFSVLKYSVIENCPCYRTMLCIQNELHWSIA